jgi:hypothetical protein
LRKRKKPERQNASAEKAKRTRGIGGMESRAEKIHTVAE